jgi:hypothetical protein
MQLADAAHDTPVRESSGSTGAAWIDHVAPFQRSARVDEKLASSPTAVQSVASLHDTELINPPGVGLVIDWRVHVPAIDSSAIGALVYEEVIWLPTAIQTVVLQEIPESVVVKPGG